MCFGETFDSIVMDFTRAVGMIRSSSEMYRTHVVFDLFLWIYLILLPYVCCCKTQIGGGLNLLALARWSAKDKKVLHAQSHFPTAVYAGAPTVPSADAPQSSPVHQNQYQAQHDPLGGRDMFLDSNPPTHRAGIVFAEEVFFVVSSRHHKMKEVW